MRYTDVSTNLKNRATWAAKHVKFRKMFSWYQNNKKCGNCIGISILPHMTIRRSENLRMIYDTDVLKRENQNFHIHKLNVFSSTGTEFWL